MFVWDELKDNNREIDKETGMLSDSRRSLGELLQATPKPAPILLVLLIVVWLCVPFIASVAFMLVILAIFAAAEV